MDPIDRFHQHLDGCQQCERHPFDLCGIGAALLMATATEAHEKTVQQERENRSREVR